jgi:catechol 2,3-dioxygenase-like lactoylglutathione lyase family enzyme
MFKIGRLFHVTHVVSDLNAVDRWYDDVFSCTRYYHGFAKAAGRDASLLAIGEIIMEPMSPANVPNLRNQSVRRFYERFCQHFHSIAWYADDIPDLSTHLAKHHLRQWDVMGRQVTPPNEKYAVWTHPRETHGQLEFAVIERNTTDPRLQPAWSSDFWRERHPLEIEGAAYITFVVKDCDAAKRLYCEVLGGTAIHEEEISGRKRSTFVALGEDTVLELAQPLTAGTLEAQDLERNGEGVHALIFQTRNAPRAAEFLKSKGMKPAADGVGSIVLGPDQAFGMVMGFTEHTVPNDPRAD